MSKYTEEKKISAKEVKELLEALDGWGIVFENEALVDEKLKSLSFYFRWEKQTPRIMITLDSGVVSHVAANQEIAYDLFGEDEKPYQTYGADQLAPGNSFDALYSNSLEEWAAENNFDLSSLEVKSGLSKEEENEVNQEDRQADEFLHMENQYSEGAGDLQ